MPRNRGRPGPHPEPPHDLAARGLPLARVAGPWVRCHRCHREPLYFGTSGDNRFDAPTGQFGVLYLAEDAHAAFIETFGQDTGIRAVTRLELERRCLSWIEPVRPLALVDLSGAGLARLGADERLAAGEHGVAQRWSLALWQHPARPDGLLYRARHDPSRVSVALYDRVADQIRVSDQRRFLDPSNEPLPREILATYGFEMLSEDDA